MSNIEILAIGGYNEVGKNMTSLKIDDDVVIFDAGVFLPPIVELQEAEKLDNQNGNSKQSTTNEKMMRGVGAIPNDLILDKIQWRDKVRAMLIGHAHLDHVGAVPYLSYRYKADVVGTPFTIEVLKQLIQDNYSNFPNKLKVINPNSSYFVKGKNNKTYEVEFLNITHSTPQTALMVIHTKEGAIAYANDYKLDNSPVMGPKPNYEAFKRLSKEGVKALIIDSLYASSERKTPSEKIARDLLEEVMLTVNNEHKGMIVTTFSSHIARLKSIVEFSKKLNREVIFLGRSLKKYTQASMNAKICPFEKQIRIGSYKKQVLSYLKKASKDKSRYVVVCTGHQGEPGSILERLSREALPNDFNEGDNIIFSSSTIPVPINISNKEKMDKKFKKDKVRIFDDVHVSGHGGREDARDLIKLLNPEHIIPSHGGSDKTIPMMELCKELGYSGKNCHLMENGKILRI